MHFDPRWDVIEEQYGRNSGHYESIFTLANGYLGTRGATEEGYWGRVSGTYLAGLFDAAPREVTELANLPDWLSVELNLAGEAFDLTTGEILDYFRVLRLKDGVLERFVRWKSPRGRISQLRFLRFVSIYDQHLAALRIEVIPEDYSGTIHVRSRLDGQVTNSGTQHFAAVEASTFGERGIYLISESYEQRHLVVQAASHRAEGEILREEFANGPRRMDYSLELAGQEGVTNVLEKLVTTFSSRDLEFEGRQKSQEMLFRRTVKGNREAEREGFASQLAKHREAWAKLWNKADLTLDGPDFDQLALRFSIFHMIQMAPWQDHRVSVSAKGLSGEGYRGHVFWDTEIFILPFFLYVFPEEARLQLRYRHHTLPGALRKAKENGYEGAMFAWESADTGDETTPTVGAIDFRTKKPIPILCGEIEQHITADIAYAISHYLHVTGDREFLQNYGADVVLLGARFWASRVEYNSALDSYEIRNVIGPDEYKEHVDNNYYTNFLVQKHLLLALELMVDPQCRQTADYWGFTAEEAKKWAEVAQKIRLPRQGDLLEQFDGFFELNAIDVLQYRDTPGTLQRAYGWREINQAQVLKQADVIMLLHLFPDEFTPEEKRANWDFYEPKTMHDSSLSAAMHSVVASDLGLSQEAYAYFEKASRIDLGNALMNSGHGLHAASLGGLWQAAVHGFAGVRVKDQVLKLNPRLPENWSELKFNLQVGTSLLRIEVTQEQAVIALIPADPSGEAVQAVQVRIGDEVVILNQDCDSVRVCY
jgi:trehalose/maltose hydrolase-like predicted phosphorylase